MASRTRVKSFNLIAAVTAAAALHAPTAAIAATQPSAPRSVKACAAIPSAMKVSWRPPSSTGGAKIDRYKVTLGAADVPKVSFRYAADKRSASISGLEHGKTYSFTVRAHNEIGWGEVSKTAKTVVGGFGTIRGACGVTTPQLDDPSPSLFTSTTFDLKDDAYGEEDYELLTPGAQQIHDSPNAGGTSLASEVLAFETLARFEGASLLKTEADILYAQNGKKTDMLVEIARDKVGVSVARFMSSSPGSPPAQDSVTALLTSKLDDIRASSANVSAEDAWVKQILVALAIDNAHVDAIETAWANIDADTKADTIVYVVLTEGDDSSIYFSGS